MSCMDAVGTAKHRLLRAARPEQGDPLPGPAGSPHVGSCPVHAGETTHTTHKHTHAANTHTQLTETHTHTYHRRTYNGCVGAEAAEAAQISSVCTVRSMHIGIANVPTRTTAAQQSTCDTAAQLQPCGARSGLCLALGQRNGNEEANNEKRATIKQRLTNQPKEAANRKRIGETP